MPSKLVKILGALGALGCVPAFFYFFPAANGVISDPQHEETDSAAVTENSSALRKKLNVEKKAANPGESSDTADGRLNNQVSGVENSVHSDMRLERWKLIMNENRLTLISSGSLRLSEAAVALMELSPEQAQSVNLVIEKFLDRLRAEEIAHAYVSVDKDGNEQIVVRPFDRTKMIEAFRNELQTAGGAEVARFIADRSTSNSTLAAGNWEMRAYREQTQAGEKEAFERTLEAPVSTYKGRAMPPDLKLVSKSTVGLQTRIRHLFAAMDQLPRVVENPPATKPLPVANPKK